MPRPPLPIGSYGRITRIETEPGRWYARTRFRDFDGRVRLVQAHGKSGAAAERALIAALADRSMPSGEDLMADTAISTLWEVYLSKIVSEGRAPRTLDRYRYVGGLIVAAAGGVRIREATTQRLGRVVQAIGERNGPTVGRTARVLLSGMFRMAVQYGAATVNSVREVSAVSVPTKASRALTLDELRAILRGVTTSTAILPPASGSKGLVKTTVADYCQDGDLADAVSMFAATGARISEVLGVRWCDVDLEAKTVTISGHIVRPRGQGLIRMDGSKTKAGERVLPLPDFAVAMLMGRQVAALPNPHDVVFPSTTGALRDPDNLGKQWRRVRVALGFEWVTTHTFRRTIATLIDDAGLSARIAADQLGHAAVSMTTDVYMARGRVHSEVAGILESVHGRFENDE